MSTRIIGNYSSNKKGPLLFVTGGVHGNEPSGVKALEMVFEELEKNRPEINGRIVGVRGNTAALEKDQRFIDEDLNRTWTEENVKKKEPGSREQQEMHEIIRVLEKFPESDYTKRYFLDCHTTSSDSLPYISVQEVHDNDPWAHRFPTYIVRGFSDIVYGAIDHYMSRTGLTGFVFEAGQHTSERSVENHEGVIWLALKEACGLELEKISCYPECVDRFVKKNAPDQKTFEIVYRHEIKDGDSFKMQPGYENFQPIKKGELLAMSNGKEIKSEWDAFIFMPLYQSQGNDGFFIIEEV
jgi:succinylglutamate desuccinylase